MKKLLYISIVLGLAACTKQIPFDDPGMEPMLVINSFVEPNDSISLTLSRSASILRPGDVENLDEADVELFENGTSVGQLTPDGNGVFRLDYAPTSGNEYEVRVTEDELGAVVSRTAIPAPVAVSNVTIEETTNVDDDGIQRVSFDLDDPTGDNFYILHLVEITPDGQKWDISFVSIEPFFTGGSQDNYFWNGAAFRDDAFDGQVQRISIDVSNIWPEGGNDYYVQLISASEEHFLYHISYEAYMESNGDPFSQPVQIYSNVEDGLGIFAGHIKTLTILPE